MVLIEYTFKNKQNKCFLTKLASNCQNIYLKALNCIQDLNKKTGLVFQKIFKTNYPQFVTKLAWVIIGFIKNLNLAGVILRLSKI